MQSVLLYKFGAVFLLKTCKVIILYYSIPFLKFGQLINLTKSILSGLFHWKYQKSGWSLQMCCDNCQSAILKTEHERKSKQNKKKNGRS